jgi:hypothetical protein
MQRALIQYRNPKNYELVVEALKKADRMDLIGFDKNCLIRPRQFSKEKQWVAKEKTGTTGNSAKQGSNQSNTNSRSGAKAGVKSGIKLSTKSGLKTGAKAGTKPGGNLNAKSNGKLNLDSRTKTSTSQNRKFDDVQRSTQSVKQTTVQRQKPKAGNAKISNGRSKSQAQGKRR